MSDTTKRTRREHWRSMGFAGTIDWATDLQTFTGDDLRGPEDIDWNEDEELAGPLDPCEDDPYDTVEDVQDNPDIPDHCRPVHMAEFNTYADAVVQGGDAAVRQFMYENGDGYFDCKVWEQRGCCAYCHIHNPGDPDDGVCRYCSDGLCGGWVPSCDNPWHEGDCSLEWDFFAVEPACPPDFSKRAGPEPVDGYQQSVEWSLRGDRESDFWADLYTAVGIEEKDIKFEDVERKGCSSMTEEMCLKMNWDYNFPVTEGFERDDVLNPKDVVEDAYQELQGFVRDLPEAVKRMRAGTYEASAFDLVNAIALPIFMVEQAVTTIQEIADTVDEWDRKKRESIILGFLSAIFFFVPVIGQLAGTVAALGNVARILVTIGTAGSVALDIYDVVNTEGNDPLSIFGLVLAPLAVFDGVQMARAAAAARSTKHADIKKLGDNIGGKLTSIRKTTAPFCSVRPATKRAADIFADPSLPMSDLLDGEAFGSLVL
ncbi:hypothetical protein VTK26DRAFT_959 [Humicola hyalothermophila]